MSEFELHCRELARVQSQRDVAVEALREIAKGMPGSDAEYVARRALEKIGHTHEETSGGE